MSHSDHSQLAPILADFIPKGRDATSKAAYLVMRRIARINRQQIWDSAHQSLLDAMVYGAVVTKIKWGFNQKG